MQSAGDVLQHSSAAADFAGLAAGQVFFVAALSVDQNPDELDKQCVTGNAAAGIPDETEHSTRRHSPTQS